MPACHKALQPIDIIESPIQLNQCQGSACEIFAEYKIGDNWTIAPGYMFFNGPKDSRLGQYGENDMVYLRLKYSF